MINTLYTENGIDEYPLARNILERFKDAEVIACEHYGEVFNRRAQNFRLQKQRPALILARKQGQPVLPTPDNYGIGSRRNYYFSHMLNCIYDCRYCFLQGMYRSANYVLFVNYDHFIDGIRSYCEAAGDDPVHVFSGYDCDSLALEPVTQFARHFVPVFRDYPRALLELRTKSTQIRSLLKLAPMDNVVIAFSFTPAAISRALEHKVPGIERRLQAIEALQARGWRIGLRFDPLIHTRDFNRQYRELFDMLFARVDPDRLHSVSLGEFRLPEKFFKTLHALYPDEALFATGMRQDNNMTAYQPRLRDHMIDFCESELLRRVPREKYFPCHN